MEKDELGRKLFIYCIGPVYMNKDCYRFYNREYKPVGLNFDYSPQIYYEKYPVVFRIEGFTDKRKLAVQFDGKVRPDNYIFLYGDASVPWRSAKFLAAYMKRLEIIMKLKAEAVEMKDVFIPDAEDLEGSQFI